MATTVYWTADLVRTLPDDGNRYETVHGELLVTPAPQAWHQELVGRLAFALRLYLRDAPDFHLFTSPADISWGSDILVQPDLFVVPIAEARAMDWTRLRSLVFTIEVLSPSTARYDRFTKRRLYQSVGIPHYWIVDPEVRSVEVWTPGVPLPRIETERVEWVAPGTAVAFAVDLAELFGPL